MKLNASSMGFAIMNNVEIKVIDKETGIIKKEVTTHNKATRNMVKGILYFVEGIFTKTALNDNQLHSDAVASEFIPCFFGCGDGGVVIEDGTPKPDSQDTPQFPKLESGWTESVDYLSSHLVREFQHPISSFNPTGTCRSKLRKQEDTLTQDYTKPEYKAGDGSSLSMDSLYFYSELEVGELNQMYGMKNVYVTELGLFAGKERDKNDLLAYVKLNNISYDETTGKATKSNVLYITPRDTVVINWVITIAAIGKDNVLTASKPNDNGELEPIVVDTIEEIPEAHFVEIKEYQSTTNGGD